MTRATARCTSRSIALDEHCREFIAHAPFVLLATANIDGTCDVSPKGGPPGFVAVLDEHRLAIGDLPGNNRLDSLHNIVRNPHIGLLFVLPGMCETLRVNGRAWVVRDADVLDACAGTRSASAGRDRRAGSRTRTSTARRRSGRSNLWEPAEWRAADARPSAAAMLRDHIGLCRRHRRSGRAEPRGRLRQDDVVNGVAEPILRDVDAVTVAVPDLDRGLAFYRDVLGHSLLWRNDAVGQAGLRLGGHSATEIVLTTCHVYEPNWKVGSVEAAAAVFAANGGRVVAGPFDIPIGRLVVVQDPFGNHLVLLDDHAGHYTTDANGTVTGVS